MDERKRFFFFCFCYTISSFLYPWRNYGYPVGLLVKGHLVNNHNWLSFCHFLWKSRDNKRRNLLDLVIGQVKLLFSLFPLIVGRGGNTVRIRTRDLGIRMINNLLWHFIPNNRAMCLDPLTKQENLRVGYTLSSLRIQSDRSRFRTDLRSEYRSLSFTVGCVFRLWYFLFYLYGSVNFCFLFL